MILYRCRTPTNWLCRCGTVARALRRGGYEFEEIRVSQRRKQRLEIHDLTGQDWVPVLVDREEVVWDSHRILEYLRNRGDSPAA